MRAAPHTASPGEPEPWHLDGGDRHGSDGRSDDGPAASAPASAGDWPAGWPVDGARGGMLAGATDADADPAIDDIDADAPATTASTGTRSAFTLLPAVSDAQLGVWIHAIATRQDERALAALYDASLARVWGLVQRIVRQPALAEEVVEDTYFQVWRQALRYDPARGSAITWLLGMARSRAIDVLRREARHLHDELESGDGQAPADAAAPATDQLLDSARRDAALHAALQSLGPQPRQLVALAFFRGLSHDEIADQTRLPLGTVKSQIRRALLQLRSLLGEQGRPLVA